MKISLYPGCEMISVYMTSSHAFSNHSLPFQRKQLLNIRSWFLPVRSGKGLIYNAFWRLMEENTILPLTLDWSRCSQGCRLLIINQLLEPCVCELHHGPHCTCGLQMTKKKSSSAVICCSLPLTVSNHRSAIFLFRMYQGRKEIFIGALGRFQE
jgi:hypothetical protein